MHARVGALEQIAGEESEHRLFFRGAEVVVQGDHRFVVDEDRIGPARRATHDPLHQRIPKHRARRRQHLPLVVGIGGRQAGHANTVRIAAAARSRSARVTSK